MTQTKKISTCAMLVALATALALVSTLIPLQLPFGGSVTLASMLPIVLSGYMFGTKWGLGSAFVFSIIQMLLGAKTVAFPAISTGVYGYPKELAARVAVDTIRDFLAHHDEIREVRLMCYSGATKKALEDAMKN